MMLQTLPESKITTRSFHGAKGGAEHFISVLAPARSSIETQMDLVEECYVEAARSLCLSPDTAIFRRVFLSDVMNQAPVIRNSGLASSSCDNPVAISIVQQAPLPGSKIALLAYHIEHPGRIRKQRLSSKHLVVEKNGVRHLWSTGLCAGASNPSSSVAQTRTAFSELIETLSALDANLRDHCVRTWIFLKNVDIFYQGMTDSRRKLFSHHGMTSDTHFIASTGIEGAGGHRFDVVAMDAYSNLDLSPTQRSFLNDLDTMCPAHAYGATFERGTRISYADRSHYFISGTASIDRKGETVHPGNVMKQLDRALRNVEALLRAGHAGLDDMMHWIIYLRDPTDHARVSDHLRERYPGVPALIVQGAVCRPEWLVEVEGMAIAPNNDSNLPAF